MKKLLIIPTLASIIAAAAVTPMPSSAVAPGVAKQQILLEFKLNNHGNLSSSKIITYDGQPAVLETNGNTVRDTIEALPEIVQMNVDGQAEPAIKLAVKVRTASNQGHDVVNSVVILSPGKEATFADSQDATGKRLFQLTAKGTIIK